jgi:hypothetical protein
MADPMTLDEAVSALVEAWRTSRRFTYPAEVAPWFQAPALTGGLDPEDSLHPLQDQQLHRRSFDELAGQVRRRPQSSENSAPVPNRTPADSENSGRAPLELVPVREGLVRFSRAWKWHPVATRMKGLHGTSIVFNPHRADLDRLPENPAHRAAALTASAYTARQEQARLTAVAESASTDARRARRARSLAGQHAEHYQAAAAQLEAAFSGWWPVTLPEPQPAAPAFPTVPAVATGYGRLGVLEAPTE